MRGFEASKLRLSGGVAALIAIVAIVFGMTACQGQDPATEGSGETQPVEQKEVIAEDVSESMGVTLPSGSSYGSVPTNILSQGMVNSYGDWIYYYKVSDLLTPHRVHPDGSGDESMEWLGSSVIALNDGWAYYLGSDYCIYRMRPDGGEKEQLSTSQAYWLNVADDWLYFTDHPGVGPATKGEIWKMRVDGSGAQLLREEPSEYLAAYEGWLYFCSPKSEDDPRERKLYRMDFEGGSVQELAASASPYTLTQDWVFYGDLREGALFKMRHDGSEAQKVADGEALSMNVLGDWVYYVDDSDGESRPLCRIDIETSERQVVVDDRDCTRVYVVGDKILFYVQPIGAQGFTYFEKGSQVCIVDPDGSNLRVIDERR